MNFDDWILAKRYEAEMAATNDVDTLEIIDGYTLIEALAYALGVEPPHG